MINKNTGVGDIYIFVAILFQWNAWNEISSYKTIFLRFPVYLTSTLMQFIFFLGGGCLAQSNIFFIYAWFYSNHHSNTWVDRWNFHLLFKKYRKGKITFTQYITEQFLVYWSSQPCKITFYFIILHYTFYAIHLHD